MTRFLLLNFEDFSLNQDITKTIKPSSSFCMCCLDRDGPMFDLEKCDHCDYLDAFSKPELKKFNQLVCLYCHNVLKKIKNFQDQVLESYNILLSGEFSDSTINSKKLNNLVVQRVVDEQHLPADVPVSEYSIDIDLGNNQKDFNNVQNGTNLDTLAQNKSEMEQIDTQNKDNNHDNLNSEQSYTHNMNNLQDNLNGEQSYTQNIDNANMEQNFNHEMTEVEQRHSNMEPFTIEQNLIQEHNRLNKNIKIALEILDRNNQSFVSLSSQLQFLNGEHLSFLEPSLLSKEILTDIPLVPAKSLSTDLDNGLLNNSRLEIEIDGTDKIFYDSLDLSPELMDKEAGAPKLIEDVVKHAKIQEVETKTTSITRKSKKGRKVRKPTSGLPRIRRIKLTHEELDRERVIQAQSESYLRNKFRCETCIIGFNYKENLEDHNKRKHGPRERDNVICTICSQLISNPGSVTEHNYRHYTRYDCVQCNKRYHTHDEVTRHCNKHQCAKNIREAGTFKNKTTVQLKKTKLKMKPCKA